MYLSCIIEKLNQKLTVANENFHGAKYYDKLAYLINRVLQNGVQQFPAVDETEIPIDDTYPLTVYHRVLSKPYAKNPNDTYTARCQMLMVVFGVKEKLKVDAEQLESQLISLFPKQFTKDDLAGLEGLTDVYFEILNSNLSARDVFNGEYTNSNLVVDADTILFSIRYDAEITFRKECLNFCDRVVLPNTLCGFIEQASAQSIIDCLNDEQEAAIETALCSNEDCPDITYNVYVNGVLNSTQVLSGCDDQTINLYP